jgi:hypothetical protein
MKEYSAIANSTREVVEHFHLPLLGARVVRLDPPHREAFVRDAQRVLPLVDAATVDTLLRIGEGWRTAMMGSWWAAVVRDTTHVARIGELMRGSLTCYAGQMHAFALSEFGGRGAIKDLRKYLSEYLPRTDLRYDQPWGYAALRRLGRTDPGASAEELADAWTAWRVAGTRFDSVLSREVGPSEIEHYEQSLDGLGTTVFEIQEAAKT